MPTALVTGGSQGLGFALSRALVDRSWDVIVDGQDRQRVAAAVGALGSSGSGSVTAIAGDVADDDHRRQLVAAIGDAGLELLVNNASTLGGSPLPRATNLPADMLRRIYDVNVIAPLALVQEAWGALERADGVVVNLSSDAAVEAYAGWGGYGSSKAALDHLMAVLAVEHPERLIWSIDPGDMRTAMHQAAFPGEDISDRPLPEAVVPALLRLIDDRPPSGRHRLVPTEQVAAA